MFNELKTTIAGWIGKVQWKQKSGIRSTDLETISSMLKPNYYIILTRRSNHLSTYFISLANLLLTGKWGFYSHVLMNLEDEVKSEDDFRLIEATGTGVHYSTFNEVFVGINAVALLKPKSMTPLEWTKVMDKAMTELGKPYDSLFDLKNDQALSCVELVRAALMATDNYSTNFANFEADIAKSKNLAPEMFRTCADFEVVYEIRR